MRVSESVTVNISVFIRVRGFYQLCFAFALAKVPPSEEVALATQVSRGAWRGQG